MKIRLILTLISLLILSPLWTANVTLIANPQTPDTIPFISDEQPDSLIIYYNPFEEVPDTINSYYLDISSTVLSVSEKEEEIAVDTAFYSKIWKKHEPVTLEWETYKHNPLFNELVYMGKSIALNTPEPDFQKMYFGKPARKLLEPVLMMDVEHPETTLRDLRNDARDYITRHKFSLYTTTAQALPELTWNRYEFIEGTNSELFVNVSKPSFNQSIDKSIIQTKQISPWKAKLYTSLQFSQYHVSKNWHKGGNDYLAIVGEVRGNLDYDNREKVKWENTLLWRTGMNTVEDSIRKIMPSEDIFRLVSKYGLKATGNFYYSAKGEIQTQFFDNPKAVNSYELKARLFTPVVVDLGIGMDFKYKELSVNLSPVSFKYIYLSDTVPTTRGEFIDPNTFGIEKGKNSRKDWGSELNVILKDYHPIPELKLNSNFRFFTNYQSVTIDWEIIAELQINRFLSTRLLLNPRYDTSVILEGDKNHEIQFKQMLTIGLSFRLY